LGVSYRRNGERDVQQPAVFGAPHCFEMVNFFAAPDVCENLVFFGPSIKRNDELDVLTNCFVRGVTEDSLRSKIPGGNYAVEGFADNNVIRRRDNRSQMCRGIQRCARISQGVPEKE
jgi:hypothetical protein